VTVEDSLVERLKQAAGESAARLVKPGMKLGMGTGSTVYYTIVAVGEAWQRGDLPGLTVVPTSERTATLARKYDLPLVDLSDCPTLDLTIDGADEVDPDLQLIKGLGGALLREKIVAFASRAMVVVVDGKKPTARLGTLAPLPVEVDPFGWRATEVHLGGLGSEPTLRVRDGAPYRTDGGHYIIDCRFADGIPDPRSLQQRLRSIAGVLECGLFVDIAKYVIVAHEDGLRTMGTPPT
jgi:ribose 5-phosphate isomerase A